MKNGCAHFEWRPWWPQQLVALIGVDYFGDVVAFSGGGPRFSDTELSQVVNLGRLEGVNLNASSVTDAGLVHLVKLKRMTLLQSEHRDHRRRAGPSRGFDQSGEVVSRRCEDD